MMSSARCPLCRTRLDAAGSCPRCGPGKIDLEGTVVLDRPRGDDAPVPTAEPAGEFLTKAPLPENLSVTLDAVDGPDRGRAFSLRSSGATIGRDAGEIQLGDPLVSRRHAVIEVYGPTFLVVKDLTSTNGTYVNGRLIAYSRLDDGDEIRVGETRLVVSIERQAPP
jgi:hypothetical protein